MKKYYTLARKELGVWGSEFGDYSKQVVLQERQDCIHSRIKARDLKIVCTGDTQPEIVAGIAELS